MQTIKMHLKLSPWILIALLLATLAPFSKSQSLPFSSDFAFSETRLKRQLFRGDIPQKRPLSGNVQATELGFPLPGRWSDGKSNTINIRPGRPFQEYIDMLDGARVGRFNKGIFETNSYKNNKDSGGFSVNNFGGGNKESYKVKDVTVHEPGFGDDGGGNGHSAIFGDLFPPDKGFEFEDDDEQPINHHHQDNFQPPSHDLPNKHESPSVSYGERPPEGPQTFIHYHPVQYAAVLNFDGPDPTPQAYGPPETPKQPHSHSHSTSYGPPNHVSGDPLGLGESGGFVPSLGVHGSGHYNNKQPGYNQTPAPPDPPYRFDPFKHFPSKNPGFQTESPVALPILAQFHSSKPIKITNLKEPIQIIWRHQPHHNYHHHPQPPPPRHYGYMRRIPRFFNFMRRPTFHHPPPFPPREPPDWFYDKKKK